MSLRKGSPGLRWALLISLLVNHGVLLPLIYLLVIQPWRVLPSPPPEPLEVELVSPATPRVSPLPFPAPAKRRIRQKARPQATLRPEEKKPEPKKPEEKKPEPKKPEEKKAEATKPEPVVDPMRLKMVEVRNPESETPPENARFLSDKNRQVEAETRARQSNLVQDHPRPEPQARPNPSREPLPGSKERRIAELRRQQAREAVREARPRPSPLLRLRAPVKARDRQEEVRPLAEAAPEGSLPAAQPKRQRRAARTEITLELDHRSLDRIDGKEAERAREAARLSLAPSATPGRHERKWQRIRSALENFVPEVRPGNQTALATRAHPFALYIARMHRRIHRLWGFGFLEDLDRKPDGHQLNDMKLWTIVEIVVAPDGQVEKATIVKPSGILPFDVAALDTVFSSGPYDATPRAIRSADGKVYLHWRFHRDHRQCGTFGVDPFILTTPPRGPIDSPMAEVQSGPPERRLRQLHRRERQIPAGPTAAPPSRVGPPADPHGGRLPSRVPAVPAAAGQRISPADPAARAALDRFLRALTAGDPRAMADACGLPFLAQGKPVTSSRGELARMLVDLLREGQGETRLRLMSVMEARRALSRLPPGAEPGEPVLVGVGTLRGAPATLILRRERGRWVVRGLNR